MPIFTPGGKGFTPTFKFATKLNFISGVPVVFSLAGDLGVTATVKHALYVAVGVQLHPISPSQVYGPSNSYQFSFTINGVTSLDLYHGFIYVQWPDTSTSYSMTAIQNEDMLQVLPVSPINSAMNLLLQDSAFPNNKPNNWGISVLTINPPLSDLSVTINIALQSGGFAAGGITQNIIVTSLGYS